LKRSKIIICAIFLIASVEYNLLSYNHPVGAIDCDDDSWVAKVESSKNKIIATSVHPVEGVYNYDPDNLLDRKYDTCWCPKGIGINEFIILKIPKGSKGFKITNGVVKSEKLFKENNRIKRLFWALIAERIYESKGEEDNDICNIRKPGMKLKYWIAFQTSLSKDPIILKDNPEPQKILFSDREYFSWNDYSLKKTKDVYLVISIMDIYKGTKYNDTCISEIEIIK